MPGLLVTSKTGQLTINGLLMHTPAYTMIDLTELWLPGPTRGANVVLPHVSGTRPYAHRLTEAPHSLPMAFVGDADSGGTGIAPGDRMSQLQANIEEVIAGIPVPSVGTVSASLVLPDSTTLTADIQVNQIVFGSRTQDMVQATLEILIPAGVFA
jgi:hypothetical protein